MDLSGDIYMDDDCKWSAVIRSHSKTAATIVWEKHGMRSAHNAETAMDAAWRRLMEADRNRKAEVIRFGEAVHHQS